MTDKKPSRAPERFISLLKKAMNEHRDKLSLRQVAVRADISPAYLSLLLNGERGVPSNDAIDRLERVLNITEGDLFKSAGRPNDQALEFFRKDEAGLIVQTLAEVPTNKLSDVLKMIEKFAKKQRRSRSQ
jgi:transcriptional regulator with XRE-family HTH domain